MNWLKKYKAEIFVGGGALLAGVLSFFITISVYPSIKQKSLIKNNNSNKENNVIYSENSNEQNQILVDNAPALYVDDIDAPYYGDENLYVDVSETQRDLVSENNNNNNFGAKHEQFEIANNYDNTIENNLNDSNNPNVDEDNSTIVATNNYEKNIDDANLVEAVSMNNKTDKIKFIFPISGDVITEFAKDRLVFSETLNEWVTHDGIDILSDEASPVKASADGVVESVKMDPRYGNTIIIKHDNGCKTVYSNLSTLDLVYAGKKITSGEIISGVANGFGFESKMKPHIHFEIWKDGNCVPPLEFLSDN